MISWTFSVKYGLQMEKRKGNIGFGGKIIKIESGVIQFFK